jgi:hypothetical protein
MTTNQTTGEKKMTKQEKAFAQGASDKMSGFSRAIKVGRKLALNGDENCAAYVRGYDNSGAGE